MRPELKIATPLVVLRPFSLSDAEKVFRMSEEAALRKWIPSQVYQDPAHAEKVVAALIEEYLQSDHPKTHPIVLGVEKAETGDLIGHVGLSAFRDGVEIGFAIEDAQKRKGYATAAVTAMCAWAAQEFSLNPIFGYVARENAASRRVLVRSGFKLVREEVMPFQGSVEPVVVFEWTSI
jgi:[ribosomal protein S5]-alanine N-acetyltransferase